MLLYQNLTLQFECPNLLDRLNQWRAVLFLSLMADCSGNLIHYFCSSFWCRQQSRNYTFNAYLELTGIIWKKNSPSSLVNPLLFSSINERQTSDVITSTLTCHHLWNGFKQPANSQIIMKCTFEDQPSLSEWLLASEL